MPGAPGIRDWRPEGIPCSSARTGLAAGFGVAAHWSRTDAETHALLALEEARRASTATATASLYFLSPALCVPCVTAAGRGLAGGRGERSWPSPYDAEATATPTTRRKREEERAAVAELEAFLESNDGYVRDEKEPAALLVGPAAVSSDALRPALLGQPVRPATLVRAAAAEPRLARERRAAAAALPARSPADAVASVRSGCGAERTCVDRGARRRPRGRARRRRTSRACRRASPSGRGRNQDDHRRAPDGRPPRNPRSRARRCLRRDRGGATPPPRARHH